MFHKARQYAGAGTANGRPSNADTLSRFRDRVGQTTQRVVLFQGPIAQPRYEYVCENRCHPRLSVIAVGDADLRLLWRQQQVGCPDSEDVIDSFPGNTYAFANLRQRRAPAPGWCARRAIGYRCQRTELLVTELPRGGRIRFGRRGITIEQQETDGWQRVRNNRVREYEQIRER